MEIKLTRPITIKTFRYANGMTVSGAYVAPEVRALTYEGEAWQSDNPHIEMESMKVYRRGDGKVVLTPFGMGVEFQGGAPAWVPALRFLENCVELVKWDPRPGSDARVIWSGKWIDAELCG